MEKWISDLHYILMPASHPIDGFEKEYEAAYRCWREAWEKYRKEVGVKEPLSSDGFIIPDEMGAIFYQNECIGFASFKHGKLTSGTMPDCHWFKAWTPEAYEKLKVISEDCIICSQFTINPKFTGRGHVVRWKEILFLFNHMRFETSDAGVMAGHLNLIRGMQNAGGEEYGGVVLDPCHYFNYSGVELPGQLVAYSRESIKSMKDKKNIHGLCDDLWSRLIHVTDFSVNNKIIPLKKAV